MLDKRKLKLIAVSEMPKKIDISQISVQEKLKYVYSAKMHGHILAVTFHNIESSIAQFRIFFKGKIISECSKSAHSACFVVEKLSPERKWSNMTLKSMWWEMAYVHSAACANKQSAADTIRKFFKVGSDLSPYQAMDDFQQTIRKAQLAALHKK